MGQKSPKQHQASRLLGRAPFPATNSLKGLRSVATINHPQVQTCKLGDDTGLLSNLNLLSSTNCYHRSPALRLLQPQAHQKAASQHSESYMAPNVFSFYKKGGNFYASSPGKLLKTVSCAPWCPAILLKSRSAKNFLSCPPPQRFTRL